MESVYIILSVVIAYYLLRSFFSDKTESESNDSSDSVITSSTKDINMETSNSNQPNNDALKLFMTVLRNIGCQPILDDDGQTVTFKLQGETFWAASLGNSPFIIVNDPNWAEFSYDDPHFSAFIFAMNETNSKIALPTIVCKSDEGNTFSLSSRHSMLFCSEIKDINDYVQVIMKSFFVAKSDYSDFLRSRINESDNSNKRTVVTGFNTNK